MEQMLYHFSEGNAQMRDLLGGKGANLAEMTNLDLPVPQGFTITTEACLNYLNNGNVLEESLKEQINHYLKELEEATGKAFSDPDNLLLVSVRSGSSISMPGMMDTILNLGLNDKNVEYFATATNNKRFAYDCYRRLLQMFGNVVYGIPGTAFESYLTKIKKKNFYSSDTDFTELDLKNIIDHYKELYIKHLSREFPQDPKEQLFEAVEAVFASWNNERAIVYRELNDIPYDLGTAVNIQEMVFGNLGPTSGTGVAFTRNPNDGSKELFGEYLMNAQGEDVVAGVRTPKPISHLEETMPEAFKEFKRVAELLEDHYNNMQDIEFTIENEQLYLLQTRNGKRTAKAAFNIAVDMVNEGLITKEEAIMQIEPKSVDQLLHPMFEPNSLEKATIVSNAGLPASPGAATGKIYFDAESAKEQSLVGEKVIIVRQETSPEDIQGMSVSEAIVTSRGGMTSHAAVVARGMGTCCVVGSEDLEIDEDSRTLTYPGGTLYEGDTISVDGSSGTVYIGEIATIPSQSEESFEQMMEWAQDIAKLGVRMNAETKEDIRTGLQFNAAGVGLVRTEHMFFGDERLKEMRQFIISNDKDIQEAALKEIMQFQIEDFNDLFSLTKELPVVIRLLDPPLHEFLPHSDHDIKQVAKQLDMSVELLKHRVKDLDEVNPMLGHRGVRLAVTYPMLYKMQAEAIIRSAIELKNQDIDVKPEIMIPLVGIEAELSQIKEEIVEHINTIFEELDTQVSYQIGTMIELPRACLIADDLARDAEFFSFGTNDLTQMTYGFSRDDAGKFISHYVDKDILDIDPFQTLDVNGVGSLLKIAVEKAHQTKPNLKIGVCGELGGDPKSIEFFHQLGLDYVSCSPFRVPVAQLAAAQSTIKYDMV